MLRARAVAAGLKGTILLAEEGINLFLAGEPMPFAASSRTCAVIRGSRRSRRRRAGRTRSRSRRMLVKVKREIIRMDHPTIRPDAGRAPAVAPADAASLARRRATTTRVARSSCSTRATPSRSTTASFAGALDWRIERFTQFPDAASAHRAELEGKTVVSYCTGGIRCEKAAMYLREEGVDAFQLDGGILGYFEEVGGDHLDGRVLRLRRARGSDTGPASSGPGSR